jgi:hypothetical protein
LAASRCREAASLGITRSFPRLCPTSGLVTFALLTLAPLALRPVRLACLIHAANVHSEPGSNPSRLGRRPKTSPFLGFEESDNTNWSPRVRDREEMNPRPHVPRQHEPSDSTGDPLRDPRREQIGPHPRRLPSRDRSKSLRVRRRSTGLSKTSTEGSIPPSTRPAGATRPKEGETPAACSHPSLETTKRPEVGRRKSPDSQETLARPR